MENVYVAKFLGITKLMLSLVAKTGLKRLSSYMLIFMTAVPVSFGWILIGKIYTQGLYIQVSSGIVVIAIVMNMAPIIFYIARTLAPPYSKQKFLKSLGIQIDREQLTELIKTFDDMDETVTLDSLTKPTPKTPLVENNTISLHKFAELKSQVQELITLLKPSPVKDPAKPQTTHP